MSAHEAAPAPLLCLDIEMAASFRSNDPDALLCEVQAADFLCLSPRTLQGWRLEGTGPRFVRAGRAIRYRRRDLIAWIDENTVERGSLKPSRTIPIAGQAATQKRRHVRPDYEKLHEH
jgi:Helix-turn-helix domain